MNPTLAMRAWEEILLDVLGLFTLEKDAKPDWLVNPATGRRLKLDRYYPELKLAVRFTGLTVKGHRQSIWEEKEDQEREETRKALCDANGVALVTVEPLGNHPADEIGKLCRGLSRTSRRIAPSKRIPHQDKVRALEKLAQARQECSALSRRVHRSEDLIPLAERYRDRESVKVQHSKQSSLLHSKQHGTSVLLSTLRPGVRVRHEKFGSGVVVGVDSEEEDDAKISIRFGDETRTFLLPLVQNRLSIIPDRGEP